jgi:hypothetical protein
LYSNTLSFFRLTDCNRRNLNIITDIKEHQKVLHSNHLSINIRTHMPIKEDQKCSMGKIKTQRLYLSYSIHTILRKDKQKLKKLRNKLKEKKEKNLLINQKLMQEQMLNFSTTEVDKISKQEMLTTIFIINPHGMRRKIEITKR